MNNIYKLGFFVMLIFVSAGNPSEKRAASRKYREIETVYRDSLNPERNYRRKEKIDGKGNIVESCEWNNDGKIHERITFDINPNCERKTVYNAMDSVVLTESTFYDSRGRKIQYVENDRRKHRSEIITFTYNKWGEKSEEKMVKNGHTTQIKKLYYNNQGLLTDQVITDSLGVVKSIKKISYSK